MNFESMKRMGITRSTDITECFTISHTTFYIAIVDGYMVALAVDLGDEMKYLVQGYVANTGYAQYSRDLYETLYARYGVITRNGSIRFPADAHIIH